MFSYTIPLKNHDSVTAASFESEPPYEVGWARQGSLFFGGEAWGATDNVLKADIYWGEHIKGWPGTNADIIWEQDTTLTKTLPAPATTSTEVGGTIAIPHVKGRFMKVVFTLSGAGTKSVNVRAWFHGNS